MWASRGWTILTNVMVNETHFYCSSIEVQWMERVWESVVDSLTDLPWDNRHSCRPKTSGIRKRVWLPNNNIFLLYATNSQNSLNTKLTKIKWYKTNYFPLNNSPMFSKRKVIPSFIVSHQQLQWSNLIVIKLSWQNILLHKPSVLGPIAHQFPPDGSKWIEHTSIVHRGLHQWAECGKALERRVTVPGSLASTVPTQIPQIHKGIGTRLFILYMNMMLIHRAMDVCYILDGNIW